MTPATSSWEHHIDDERLVDLVVGEEPAPAERAHLETCSVCRESLAALSRTVAITRDSHEVDLVAPGGDLWSRIELEIDAEPEATQTTRARDSGEFVDTADPRDAVARQRRSHAAAPRRRPALIWLAAACAAGALLGAGGVVAAERLGGTDAPASRELATARLDTLSNGQPSGSATVVQQGEGVRLEVSAQRVDPGDGYVEVWLINRDGKRMVSVGVLGWPDVPESFSISQRLLDEGYVVVDISREHFDDKPEHSGDSLVRGTLTTPA